MPAARHVLVTGASSGIGRSISLRLLDRGHRVLGIARDFAKFPGERSAFERVEINLADLDALPGLLERLAARHPEVDALVLNAGRGRFGCLFTHGSDEENYVLPEEVAELVVAILEARPGTVVDEIRISPLKRVVRRREDRT